MIPSSWVAWPLVTALFAGAGFAACLTGAFLGGGWSAAAFLAGAFFDTAFLAGTAFFVAIRGHPSERCRIVRKATRLATTHPATAADRRPGTTPRPVTGTGPGRRARCR